MTTAVDFTAITDALGDSAIAETLRDLLLQPDELTNTYIISAIHKHAKRKPL